jgi:hypothetical protein
LYSSDDGGRTWHRRLVHRPAGYRSARRLYDLPTFTDGFRVLPLSLIDHHRQDVAFYSNPAGPGAWRLGGVLRAHLNARHSFPRPIPTSVASPSKWWAFYGRGDHLAITRDGGDRWTRRKAHVNGAPESISAVGGRTAWVTTADAGRSFLFLTRSRGKRWRRLRPWR